MVQKPKGFIWIDGKRYYTVEEAREYMNALIKEHFDKKNGVV